MWGRSRSGGSGHKYRIRELTTARVWDTFETPDELKPGAALDKLADRIKSQRLPKATRYRLEHWDSRRGWVRVAAQTD
jgi:hypothetical protein